MFITSFIHYYKGLWHFRGSFKVIVVKISQNFIKSHLKICLISQVSVHSLWHACQVPVWKASPRFSSVCTRSCSQTLHRSVGHRCSYAYSDIYQLLPPISLYMLPAPEGSVAAQSLILLDGCTVIGKWSKIMEWIFSSPAWATSSDYGTFHPR